MKIIPIFNPSQWHEIRAQHVGGSEVAALFTKDGGTSLSPYQTRFELWHVKAGTIPAEDLSDNERVQAGNFMEPAIAAWASEKWGVKLSKFQGYAVHATVKGMGCTPDYMNDDASLNVQIKNVDGLEFYKNPAWEAEGEELTSAPMHILLQCQHELACTGAKQAWLIVCIGGNRLVRMVIEPRPKTIAKLETEVAAFWQSIADKVEPKPNFESDGETIAAIYAEAETDKVVDLTTNNRAHEVVAKYLQGHEQEKAGKTMKDVAKAELVTLLGDASKAMIGDIIVNATTVKANKGKQITESMIGMIIGGRAGYRRFNVSQPEGASA